MTETEFIIGQIYNNRETNHSISTLRRTNACFCQFILKF